MITLPNYEMRSMRETSQKMRELKSLHFQENRSMVCSVSPSCRPASRLCPVCRLVLQRKLSSLLIKRIFDTSVNWGMRITWAICDKYIGVCTYKQQWLINTLEINFGRERMQITWMNGWIVVDATVFLRVFILIFNPADIAVSNMTDLVPLGGITWWR